MIGEFVGQLGLSGQIATAVSVGLVAWYLWRVGTVASLIVGVLSSASRIMLACLVLLAGMIAMGWLDPVFGRMLEDVLAVVRWIGERPVEWLRQFIEVVIGGVWTLGLLD